MYAGGYEVYHHPPFLLIGLHSIGCKCKVISFNQRNEGVYTHDQHSLLPHIVLYPLSVRIFFCGVPAGASVKVGCAVGKQRVGNSDTELVSVSGQL
jgi:hypothetical protein